MLTLNENRLPDKETVQGAIKMTAMLLLFIFGFGQAQAQTCTADFSWQDTAFCSVAFYDNSTHSGSAAYFWDFGDGNTSTTAGTTYHTYDSAGTYQVSLVIMDSTCTDTMVQSVTNAVCDTTCYADFNFSIDASGDTVNFYDQSYATPGSVSSWQWDFDDGNSSTSQNPTHTYADTGTYEVCLVIETSAGCADTVCKVVEVTDTAAANCEANFLYYPDSSGTYSIYFSDQSTASGTIVSWNWDFGDGNTSTQQNPNHTYDTSGMYTACLVIETSAGCTDTVCKVVEVTDTAAANCEADFLYYPDSSGTYSIYFSDQSTASGTIVSWTWDFGDGNTSTQQNPYHMYDSAGWYMVCLTIETDEGCVDTYCQNVWVSPPCPNLMVMHKGEDQMPCTSNGRFYIYYGNVGSQAANNVDVSIALDPEFIPKSSNPPWDSQSGNSLTWNIGTLQANQSGIITVYDSVDCNISSGQVACATSVIMPFAGDCDTSNNTYTFCDSLGYSYDPNDKRVASQQMGKQGWVNKEDITASDDLEYSIRFQNTGTAPAVDVIIRDTLDTDIVNPSTVIPMVSSHEYDQFSVTPQGVLTWKFQEIMLPDSNSNEPESKGFVTFRVQQRPGNPEGTVIRNNAAIYFDMNEPIITNETENVIPLSEDVSEQPQEALNLHVYPNPVQDVANIVMQLPQESGVQITVLNAMGQTVINRDANLTAGKHYFRLHIHDLAAGIYFARVHTNNQVQTVKFVKKR